MSENGIKYRIAVSALVLTAAICGLGFRLAFLHLGHPDYRERVDARRSIQKELLASRGTIYDRHGTENVLAMNLAVKDVCADPKVIVNTNRVLDVAVTLADLLELDVDTVAVSLNRPDRRFAYIKRFVHEDRALRVQDAALPGVFFRDATVRYYPHGSFLCHVLGFVNYEGVGSAGIEQRLDGFLRGCPGFMESRVNARRQELYAQRNRYIPALEGADVELTIDQNMQYFVERALDDVVEAYHAKGAWVIVQRVKTGEILAMASRPDFDLNEFRATGVNERLNRAIGCVYEPGSTFKAVTVSAALNERLVTPDTPFDCENGSWLHQKRILRDYHPYGTLTLADVVKKSSNIGSAKVALMLGEKRFYNYLRAFGIGSKLGIDLPGEEAGILAPVNRWSGISTSRIAIGQGVAVTALQMLNVYATIANDGFMMRPYVIRRATAHDGTVLVENEPQVIGRPITYETAATTRVLLGRVTEDGGTGRRARVDGYAVAGKTGTAQKPENGGYSSTKHTASFCGFLPADAPEIALIVVVDEPQPIHTGGQVAAPVFSDIATQAVRYLDVPEGPETRMALNRQQGVPR
jgi:cell division protein FtsI (penicillin-binding protein 3)